MSSTVNQINDLTQQEYKWGFVTSIDEDRLPPGLNEDIVRAIAHQEGRAGIHAGVAAEGVSLLGVAGAEARRADSGPT